MSDLTALAPEIIVGGAALAILVFDTFAREKHNIVAAVLSLLGVAGAFGATAYHLVENTQAELFNGMLVVDDFSIFFNLAVLIVSALVLISSFDYMKRKAPKEHEYMTEYAALVLFATSGMMLMASSRSLVTAVIALELTSLPSYALVAFVKSEKASVEGGMKYFLLGALSSSVILYGISLVYGVTGTFDLIEIAGAEATPLLGMGALFILFGLAFKVAAVPFQVWAPDAYTGAPTPIAGLISSASKIAGFVLLFRIFTVAFPVGIDWVVAVQILAIVTMTFGNFAAAVQSSVKRMLAYSSIGHAGYVLITLAVFSSDTSSSAFALSAGMAHLFVYGIMNTGAFLVVALIDDYWGFGYEFEDYAGIAKQVPVIGIAMGIFMFSLAGLPVGAGFVSKLFVFWSAVEAGAVFWPLVLLGAINSTLSLYYYTRVLKYMWVEEPNGDQPTIEKKPIGLYTAILAAAVATVVLMFAFSPVIEFARDAADVLVAS